MIWARENQQSIVKWGDQSYLLQETRSAHLSATTKATHLAISSNLRKSGWIQNCSAGGFRRSERLNTTKPHRNVEIRWEEEKKLMIWCRWRRKAERRKTSSSESLTFCRVTLADTRKCVFSRRNKSLTNIKIRNSSYERLIAQKIIRDKNWCVSRITSAVRINRYWILTSGRCELY